MKYDFACERSSIIIYSGHSCRIRTDLPCWFELTELSVRLWFMFMVEETGVPRENHRPAVSHQQTLSHNVVSCTPRLSGIRTHNVNGDGHWLHG